MASQNNETEGPAMDLKALYQKYAFLFRPLLYAKNRLLSLRIRGGSGNRVLGIDRCLMRRCRITFAGTGNTVEIGDMSTLQSVQITVCGSHNHVLLGDRVSLLGCTFSIEDDSNEINVGSHTYIYNGTELAAIEGTKITLGADCLLSSNIMIRTGDSHSILDEQGNRINPSGGISIGDHVWIGKGAVVLKNAQIGNNCVIGTGTLVTRSTETLDNAILAGNPAKPIRRNITWDRERI